MFSAANWLSSRRQHGRGLMAALRHLPKRLPLLLCGVSATLCATPSENPWPFEGHWGEEHCTSDNALVEYRSDEAIYPAFSCRYERIASSKVQQINDRQWRMEAICSVPFPAAEIAKLLPGERDSEDIAQTIALQLDPADQNQRLSERITGRHEGDGSIHTDTSSGTGYGQSRDDLAGETPFSRTLHRCTTPASTPAR